MHIASGEPDNLHSDKDTDNVVEDHKTPTKSEGEGQRQQTKHDDNEWEDDPDYNLAYLNEKSSSSSPPTPRDTIRKRRGRTQLITRPATSRKGYVRNRNNIRENVAPLVDIDAERIKEALASGAVDSANYSLSIFKNAMRLLRYPFAILLALWMLAFIFSRLQSAFHYIFAPLCYIPGFSSSPLCYVGDKRVARWADYPKLVDVQSSTFEQLLDESVGGQGLSLEVKKAEMATVDLVTLVKVSDLKSRDMLARTLEDFVSDAKKTGRGLQKLSSKIAGAVDSILAVNDHALHTIEAHVSESKSALSILWPFPKGVATTDVITQTFTDAMSVLSTQMARVILEAEVSLANLDNLEQRLITLQELLHRENVSMSAERSELLAQLWTLLGGNKRKVRGLDNHLFLLRNIGEYRTRALAHVVAAMQTLQSMSEDMEDLRERVAAPELVGDRIPVEVHMKSIKAGLDRLTEKRYQAKEREEAAVRKILGMDEEKD